MPVIQFAINSYQSRSLPLSAQRALNVFAERQPADTKTQVALFGAPGLKSYFTCGTGPIRAMHLMSGILYVISGSDLYSVTSSLAITKIASVVSATGSIDTADNGSQLVILNNQAGYVLSVATTGPLAPIGSGQVNILVGSIASISIDGHTGDTFIGVDYTNTVLLWQVGDDLTINLDNGNPFHTTVVGVGSAEIQINPPMPSTAKRSNLLEDTTSQTITTLVNDLIAGQINVNIQTALGMTIGDTIIIALDNDQTYTGTITNVVTPTASIQVADALPSNASIGNGVANTTTRLYPITDINFYPANTVNYFDNYFIFDRAGTNQYIVSALGDGTTFPGLYFASAQVNSDNVVATLSDHEMLLIFGSNTVETWYDAGTVNFPFQRYDGATIERGLAAPLAVVKEDNAVFFLGDDIIFYRLQGVLPLRLSTHAIESAWQQYTTIIDATCYSYSTQGHKLVVLTFPTAMATWVYDISTGLWHERDSLDADGNSIGRWRGNCTAYAFGNTLIGDSMSGQVGIVDWNTYTEFSSPIRGLAVSPPYRENRARLFVSRFELEMETGVGLVGDNFPILTLVDPLTDSSAIDSYVIDSTADPQVPNFNTTLAVAALNGSTMITVNDASEIGPGDTLHILLDDGTEFTTTVKSIANPNNPQIYLDYSKDGGFTFSLPQLPRSLGRAGQTQKRLRWLRLGQAREWYFRITITDPVRRTIIQCYADMYSGS